LRRFRVLFDAIVLDIEGAEIAFITEYEDVLPRIDMMIVEFHPNNLGDDAINEAKDRLSHAGLQHVGKMLDVKAFASV
jgi:hypothetical protein